MKSHHRQLLLLLMTIRKKLNHKMENFWSGVKVVQVEKVLILAGLKDPGGWNRGRKEMHENLMEICCFLMLFRSLN